MASPAIEYPHIMITRSSAGSGKTYHLALRYLQTLLDRDCRISSILAITFTNKASQEMRSRILDYLKRAVLDLPVSSREGSPSMREALKEGLMLNIYPSGPAGPVMPFSITAGRALSGRIGTHLDFLLKHYGDFKVSTIDSFSTFIMKAVSFRLGLDPEFEILLEAEESLEEALTELIQEVAMDGNLRRVMDRFIRDYLFIDEKRLKWSPFPLLKKLIHFIWSREREKGIRISLPEEGTDLAGLGKRVQELCRILHAALVSRPDIRVESRFLECLTKVASAASFTTATMKTWITRDFNPAGTGDSLYNKNSAEVPEECRNTWDEIRSLLSVYIREASRHRIASAAELYSFFLEQLGRIMRRKKAVLINELHFLLDRILSREEGVLPEIYYYLSERYSHFLLDEFQDTNSIQWRNLEYLIREEFSRGGSLFLVGDEKQSIYRWRGGNPGLVGQITARFNQGLYSSVRKVYGLNLSRNRRSRPELVRFHNEIFAFDNCFRWLKSEIKENMPDGVLEEHLAPYRDSGQEPDRDLPEGGFIFAEALRFPGGEERDLEEELRKSFMARMNEVRSRRDPGEIAVLTRKNRDAALVVQWLMEEKIPVESDLTISIKSHPLILELVHFLKFLNEPSDNLSLINFLAGRLFEALSGRAQEKTFQWLNERLAGEKPPLVYRLIRKEQKDFWEGHIEEFFSKAGYMPLYDFILLLYKKWDLFRLFPEAAPYFLKLSEVIWVMNNEARASLGEFLNLWDSTELRDERFFVSAAEGMNAVKVLTIHKSKGLEFPVVFLPFIGSKGSNDNLYVSEKTSPGRLDMFYITKDFLPFSRELADIFYNEEIRKKIDEIDDLYVAATRARDALFMFFMPVSGNKVNSLSRLVFPCQEPKKYDPSRLSRGKEVPSGAGGKSESSLLTVPVESLVKKSEYLSWLDHIKTKVRTPGDISAYATEAAEAGKMIHYILSLVEKYEEKDLDSLVDIGTAKFGRTEESLRVSSLLKKNFSNPAFLRFFSSGYEKIMTEKEVVNDKGELKRVDRVVLYANRIEVVDFKTGEEYSEEHKKQISEYRTLMREQFPRKKVDAFLVYLDENRVINIPG